MSLDIDIAYIQQYKDGFIDLAEQKGSRLRNTVMNEVVKGKTFDFNRLGSGSMTKITSQHAATPYNSIAHSRRRVTMDFYASSERVGKEEVVQVLTDPENRYAKKLMQAAGRTIDDLIIAAATGNATSVDASESGSSVALPAGQIVDEDFGSADSNLTFEKIKEARRILMANDVDMDERLFLIVNASAHDAMLAETEFTSNDFVTHKSIIDGKIGHVLGFDVIHTERLLGTADGTDTDPVLCLAYSESALGLAVGRDIEVEIDKRPDLNNLVQIYVNLMMGSTRVEDEKMVSIQCVQS